MFTINDDLSIYVTRGDAVAFTVTSEDNGVNYVFQPGDVLRLKVFGKKDAENVVLQKEFPVVSATEEVEVYLTEQDTKIGEVISKPTDYWYEVELNPFTNPQTIIGYDEDGAKVFRLFPEGRDLTELEPDIKPEDIPIVDRELDLTSLRPVENQAIARAVAKLEAAVKDNKAASTAKDNQLHARMNDIAETVLAEQKRLDIILSGSTLEPDAEIADVRVGADGNTYESAGTAVRTQMHRISDSDEVFRNDGWCHLKGGFVNGTIADDGTEYAYSNRVKSVSAIQYDRDIEISLSGGFRYAIHFYDAEMEHTSETGWLTGRYAVPANENFRVVIGRTEETETEVADVNEFVSALKITTALSAVVEAEAKLEKEFVAHRDNVGHPKTTIRSYNLVDPGKITEGGYCAWNTGIWTERSDISSTGFIPCEKGEKFCWGVSLDSARGGNVTYWDGEYNYVSGVDTKNGIEGLTIPDNDSIKYFRISFYAVEKGVFRVNYDELKEYDEYSCVYVFDKEIVTPGFDSSKPIEHMEEFRHYYTQTYKDDVTVLHKRNNEVGASYQITVINKTKFDGTATKVVIAGTSTVNALGDSSNRDVATFAKASNFLHIVNGGIYLMVSGEADGITIIDGEILKSTGVEQFSVEQYVLGIKADGTMKAYINTTAENILNDGAVYALTAFVPLIQNGVAVDNSVLAICPHYNARHPRQIIGVLEDGNYFTFCCDGRIDGENGMTLAECIDTMSNDLAIQFAFNLDGGGSTQTAVGKKQINRVIDGRTIPNVITFE